jgi:hypothetical protein
LPAWPGQDDGVGIAYYNVDYRPEGDTSWVRWLTNYPYQSAYFVPPDGRDYWFRSQAVDALGHVEPWPATPDAGTSNAIPVHRAIIFPLVFR